VHRTDLTERGVRKRARVAVGESTWGEEKEGEAKDAVKKEAARYDVADDLTEANKPTDAETAPPAYGAGSAGGGKARRSRGVVAPKHTGQCAGELGQRADALRPQPARHGA